MLLLSAAVTEFTAFGRDAVAQLLLLSWNAASVSSSEFSPLPVQKTSVAPHGGCFPCSHENAHARASRLLLLRAVRVGVPPPLFRVFLKLEFERAALRDARQKTDGQAGANTGI